MKNKKAFSIPFGWIFAVIVGGAILFLTIYGVTGLISSGEEFKGCV